MASIKKIEFKRNSWGDERGWGLDLLAATGLDSRPVGDLHVVSIKPGKMRGNHYHQNSTEWLLFLGGKARLIWRESGRQIINEVDVHEPGPTLYMIPPKVEHAVINEDQCDICLAAISDVADGGTVQSVGLVDGAG